MSEDKPSPPPPATAPPSQSPTGQEQPTSPSSSSQPPPPPPLLKHTQDLNYMHRPPRIVPNYGKKPRGLLPKSNLSRVLLYDNVTQQQMLHVKMNHLKTEQRKTGHLLDLHRKSFMVRRQQKQKHLAETTLHVSHTLPVLTITTTTTTTTAEKPPGAKPRIRKAWGESPQRGEDVNEPQGDLLTPRSTAGEGGGSEKEGTLLSLTRRRQGASTSQGFALHPLAPVPAAQRGLHTAAMVQREGQDALPDLTPRTSARSEKVHLLHMDNGAGGLTRMMHTFQRRGSRGVGERGGKGRKGKGGKAGSGDQEKTTEDERYRKLEKMLVRIEPPNEGYMELSPSFHTPRQAMTFTRPSSFYSSVYRSRSSSLAPRRRIIIGSLLPYVIV